MSIKVKIAYIAYMGKIWDTGYSHSSRWRKRGLYRFGRQLSIHPELARFGRSYYWLTA
jgi:predicted heme/steroid binding protein